MVARRYLDDDDDAFENGVCKDGRSTRVPVMLMDSLQRLVAQKRWPVLSDVNLDDHRPHHPELSPELRGFRAATRSEYVAGLQDAWRSPAQRAKSDAVDRARDPAEARAAATASYHSMCARLQDAWRRPPIYQDRAEPDLNSRPEELASYSAPGEPDAGFPPPDDNARNQAKRDAIYKDYVARLSSAWQQTVGPGLGNVGTGPNNVGPRPRGNL
jgi:hypothetical protein